MPPNSTPSTRVSCLGFALRHCPPRSPARDFARSDPGLVGGGEFSASDMWYSSAGGSCLQCSHPALRHHTRDMHWNWDFTQLRTRPSLGPTLGEHPRKTGFMARASAVPASALACVGSATATSAPHPPECASPRARFCWNLHPPASGQSEANSALL